MSFECIQQSRLSIAELISLMSLFDDQQGILETLPRDQTEQGDATGTKKEAEAVTTTVTKNIMCHAGVQKTRILNVTY